MNRVSVEECKEQLFRELAYRKENNNGSTLLFVDLKAAYDSVDLVKLMSIV